jgi:hypothetical protein
MQLVAAARLQDASPSAHGHSESEEHLGREDVNNNDGQAMSDDTGEHCQDWPFILPLAWLLTRASIF